MKTKLGIVGCGFLGNIVADAWKKGLLPDYELVGVTSRTRASAEKTAANVGCAVCEDMDALLALEPEYIVEAASVESVRAMAIPALKRGVNLVILSIGAFADLDFYAQVKAAAVEGGAKVHLASHLLTDTEKTTVFTGNAKQAIATFPRRVNVAVATSLATTGPEITGVTMHSVPGWVGDDHCITAEIEGVKAVVDICSSTSAIAGWSVVALLRNLASPICFCRSKRRRSISSPCRTAISPKLRRRKVRTSSISECITLPSAFMMYEASTSSEKRNELRSPSYCCWAE